MKPVDGIELALKVNGGVLSTKEILALIKDLVNEDGLDRDRIVEAARSEPTRFELTGSDSIRLKAERLADRVGYFRTHLLGLRDALRLMPFTQTQGLELALVYLLATRSDGTWPSISRHGEGLRPALDDLIHEFPDLQHEVAHILEAGGILVHSRVQSELLQMASAQLTPVQFVQEMRNIVLLNSAMGQFCLPWSVAELMSRLLGNDIKEVFDPAADASVLPVVLALNGSAKAEAAFVNRFAQFFTTIQARVLSAELTTALNEKPVPDNTRRYSHCISAPPFGGRVREEGSLRAIEPYEIATNKIIKHLAPGGSAVVLVPESMLFLSKRTQLRKQLLDLGMLKAIVSLPVGTFAPYAGVKASILVLDRSRTNDATVRFVDAGQFIASRAPKSLTIDVEAVLNAYGSTSSTPGVLDVKQADLRADEEVSWSMSRFSSQLQLDHIISEAHGMAVVELGSVLHDDILSMGDHAGLPLFQVSELSSEVLDMTRTARHGQTEPSSVKKGPKRLDVAALLLARVGGKLKPTMFDPVDGPIAVGSNVFIFRVDPVSADAEYLATELRSPTVQDQLDAYHQGSTIPSIAKADLLRVRVRLPDLQEQHRLVRERKEAILLAKKEEIARQEEKHGLSVSEWQILGSVEHSFRPVVSLLEQPMVEVRGVLSTMDPETREIVASALERMDGGLDRMRSLFKLINDVVRSDKESLHPGPVDLRRLFRSEVRGLGQQIKDLRIYFQCDDGIESEDGVIAHVDRNQFALVVQNLFTNMAKHAMSADQDAITVLVRVSTRTDRERTWLVITIENNGQRFREGFTHQELITFGKRTDANNGNGVGGFLMDRIIANHRGRFTSCNLPLTDESDRSGFRPDQRIDENHWEPHDWETALTNMSVQFTIELPNANG